MPSLSSSVLSRRRFLESTGAAALAASGGCRGLGASAGSRPVNLLFIMTDQQRWDAMSCAGNTVLDTPNLDRLAAGGVRFEHAYSQCPVCGPARTSILTGHGIYSTGVVTNREAHDERLPADAGIRTQATFDEVLVSAGYYAEYHGKWHSPLQHAACYHNREQFGMCRDAGMGHTYNEWLREQLGARPLRAGEQIGWGGRPYRMNPMDRRYDLKPGEALKDANGKPVRIAQPDQHGCMDVPPEMTSTAIQAKQTIAAIERAGKRPFTITCSFHFPHSPYNLPEPYYSMHPPGRMPIPESIDDPMDNSPYVRANGRPDLPEYRDPARIGWFISSYYGLVKEIDDWVGRILAALDHAGVADHTLVVFTSDHGEMLGSHGMREKNVFYDESVHIPLLLRLPGRLPAGQVVDTPVSQIDLFATILDYTGMPARPSHGESLRRLVEGAGPADAMVVSEWRSDHVPGFMVCSRDWKFLFGRSASSPCLDALYDMRNDPREVMNLIGRHPERGRHAAKAEEMKQLLLAWLRRTGSPWADSVAARPVLDPSLLPADADEVSVVLSDPPQRRGMTFVTRNAVTRNRPVIVGGRPGWRTVLVESRKGLRYVYFRVNHAPFEDGRAPACALSLDYVDAGRQRVRVVYDSSDPAVKVVPRHPGAWKQAGVLPFEDSGTWKTATFRITDALFSHRCNGNDIRIEVQGDHEITLGAIRIRRE